jgi:transposase
LVWGDRWFLSVQVESDSLGTVAGVDLGSRTLATTDNEIDAQAVHDPKPPPRFMGPSKRLQRRISLQKHRAKRAGQKPSRRQHIRQLRLSRLHARLANIRKDAAHKLMADANAAINLRTIGLAKPELTRRDMAPPPACASAAASAVVKPRTEN